MKNADCEGAKMTTPTKTAEDLRGLRARARVPIFLIGAAIGKHQATVGEMLNGRIPLTPEAAARIETAIEELARAEPR
jgi:hypothetical protein